MKLVSPESKVVITFELVTREQAEVWLRQSDGLNVRRIMSARVRSLTDQMQRGEWRTDACDPLRFNSKGIMVDGQHRLRALIMSGLRSLEFHIARGISNEAVAVIDSGASRALSVRVGLPAIRVAVIRAMAMRKVGDYASSTSAATVQWYAEKYGDELDLVFSVPGGIPKDAPVLAACTRAVICGHEGALDFLNGVRRCVDLDGLPFDENRTITITVARQYLTQPGPWSSTTGRITRIRKTERAIEAFLNGEAITKLYAPNREVFPIERRPD
jgi:hypothetical protein